jgi:DNA-binding MarR family transcriptional regulator
MLFFQQQNGVNGSLDNSPVSNKLNGYSRTASGRVRKRNRVDDIIDKHRPSSPQPGRRHDLEILGALRRIVRAIDIHSRRLNVQYDITTPQLICLLTLAENELMTGTLLAQRMYMSPSTVNGIVSRLQSKGLIKRTRDSADKRVVRVSLTPAGRHLLMRAPSPLQTHFVDALSALSEAQKLNIKYALDRIVQIMEADDIDAAPVLDTGELSR